MTQHTSEMLPATEGKSLLLSAILATYISAWGAVLTSNAVLCVPCPELSLACVRMLSCSACTAGLSTQLEYPFSRFMFRLSWKKDVLASHPVSSIAIRIGLSESGAGLPLFFRMRMWIFFSKN
jgi:hypothetical protein